MTKEEYMQALYERLSGYPESFRSDIMETFELHFSDGLAEGRTEEEIMQELGSVDEVAANIASEYGAPEKKEAGGAFDQDFDFTFDFNFQDKDKAPDADWDPTQFEKAKDDLNRSFSSFSDSLGKSLSGLSHIINDAVAQAMDGLSKSFSQADRARDEDSSESSYGLVLSGQMEDAQELAIRAASADVHVVLSAGEKLAYTFRSRKSLFTGKEAQLHATCQNGTALFEVESEDSSSAQSRLEITVPASVRSIVIDGASIDVSGGGLALSQIGVKSEDGDLDLQNCQAEKLSVSTKAGDLRLQKVRIDETQVSSNAGDVNIRDAVGRIRVETTAGDVSLEDVHGSLMAVTRAGDVEVSRSEGDALKVQTKAGDIHMDGDYRDISVSAAGGDLDFSFGTNLESAVLMTLSGDAEVDVSHLADDYTIEAHTISGSIEDRTHSQRSSRREEHDCLIGSGARHIYVKTVTGEIEISD